MADVVLVNPHWYMAEGNLDDLWLPIPNGPALLAAALRAAGVSVDVLDVLAGGYDCREWVERGGRRLCRVGWPDEEILRRLRESGASIVGIGNLFTGFFRGSAECAALARTALPAATIVLGGVHPSCVPEEVARLPQVDFVVAGEGELALPALVRHLRAPTEHPRPPGLFWKEGATVATSGPPEPIADLDALPLPAYDLLDMARYRAVAERDLTHRGDQAALTMPLITSRGCPHGCIFCAAHRINGRRWRARSAARVVDEMELLHRQYGVNSFSVEDSNFTGDEERALAFCAELRRRLPTVRWNTPNGLRADRLTHRLLQAFRDSGCREITLAAEHGDQDFLTRVVRKGLDLDDVVRAGAAARQAGIPVSCFLMMGFPGETERELRRTVAFGRRLAWAGILPLFFIGAPFPGTAMHKAFAEAGALPARPLEPEDYLTSFRIPLMTMPGGIDLPAWRHRAMWQAYALLALRHPVLFARLPAIRKLAAAFLSPRTCRLAWRKFYNQLCMRTEPVPAAAPVPVKGKGAA